MTATSSGSEVWPPRQPDRILLVHVMKTGGSSLRRMLEFSLGWRQVYPSTVDLKDLPNGWYLQNGPLLERLGEVRDHRVLVGHLRASLIDELPPRYEGAIVLRDPVERSLSQLDHWRRWVKPGLSRHDLLDDTTFVDRFIRDYQTKVLAKPSGEIQEPFGVTEDEVGAAITRLESLAFVGITEDFADSVRRFDARFGTSLSGTERMDNTGIFPRDGVDDVRERIEPLVQHDRALYRHARALVAGT